MCQDHSGTLLPRPWWMEGTDERLHGVPVDSCIAVVVTALWDAKLVTLSSCCGHGAGPPSFVIENGAKVAPYHKIIRQVDERPWVLYQWRLVEALDPDDG